MINSLWGGKKWLWVVIDGFVACGVVTSGYGWLLMVKGGYGWLRGGYGVVMVGYEHVRQIHQ